MPSSPKKKKLKLTAAASGGGRINTLSNKVLHRILAFLPADEAVQTCMLSRRWRDVWKSMPVLRLTKPVGYSWSPAYFNYFVNNLLFFRDPEPLDQFELWTYSLPCRMVLFPLDMQLETVRYLDMWIQYALMREVQVLRVFVRSFPDYKQVRLANSPLFSQSLTTLELRAVDLDGVSLDFLGCRSLKVLEISDSKISAQRLSSRSLRRLNICYCNFSSDTRLRIFAPNLSAFELNDFWGWTPFLEGNSMSLLVTAYIRIDGNCKDSCSKVRYGNCGFDTCVLCCGDPQGSEKCVLLGGLSNVEYLKLKACPTVTIFKRDLKWAPTFSKLKILELDGWVEPLLCILKYAPVLEKLTIQLHKDLKYELNEGTSCSPVEQIFPTEHLKIVEVKCGKVDGNALRFKKILIACGISPDKINIMDSCEPIVDRDETCRKYTVKH